MRRKALAAVCITALMGGNSFASIIAVTGPLSSANAAPDIIIAPGLINNATVTNRGQQGFNEAQGVVTSIAYATDSGSILAGTSVDSHMIFLNFPNCSRRQSHTGVVWTFSGPILGVMSDVHGTYEAASNRELGAPGTTYPGIFRHRGLERNDSYVVAGNQITVNMMVSQPGDWIRVVTADMPEPTTFAVWSLLGLTFIGGRWRPRRTA